MIDCDRCTRLLHISSWNFFLIWKIPFSVLSVQDSKALLHLNALVHRIVLFVSSWKKNAGYLSSKGNTTDVDDVVVDCRLHQYLIFPFLFLYQQIYELRTRISKRKHYLHKMHNLLFSKKKYRTVTNWWKLSCININTYFQILVVQTKPKRPSRFHSEHRNQVVANGERVCKNGNINRN